METCPHGMTLGWCVACVAPHPDPYRAPKEHAQISWPFQLPHDHEAQPTGRIPETPT